jgi:acyl-CoA dehydrogenase
VGGNEAILSLDEVRVPPERVVGDVDNGFAVGLANVAMGRLYNAAKAVGLARWGLERALTYASERQTFGKPIAEYQGVLFPLVESAMEIHAAHTMGRNCAALVESGDPATKEVAMTKAFSTEAAVRALDRAIQAHGGMGLTNEMGLAEAWHMARIMVVADGSSEILRRIVGSQLLRGNVDL